MKSHKLTALVVVLALAFIGSFTFIDNVQASSHREAPQITELPKVDGTDLYFFRSYGSTNIGNNFCTIIANFQPLEDPAGGPNFFSMDPEALYEIHISNDNDPDEELTFQFRFNNTFRRIQSATQQNNELPVLVSPADLGNGGNGTVSTIADPDLNIVETYTVTLVRGDRRTGVATALNNLTSGGTTFTKPADNYGSRIFGDADKNNAEYAAYANLHIATIDLGNGQQGRVFVGQRREAFVVDLGGAFDRINVDGADSVDNNATRFKSVTSIVLEVPTSFLQDGNNTANLGCWYTASMRQARLLNPDPGIDTPNRGAIEGGAFSQVSRLGSPLVNEVVIGVSSKDHFNASEPKDDAQFLRFVTDPVFALAMQVDLAINAGQTNGRNDLVAVFLTGADFSTVTPALNFDNTTSGTGEMLRLDPDIAPTALATQNRNGQFAGDLNAFPNGRRPIDDVLDGALKVVAGFFNGNTAQATNLADNARGFGAAGQDTGAQAIADNFLIADFPYLAPPLAGDVINFDNTTE